jgi:hypothetical protein
VWGWGWGLGKQEWMCGMYFIPKVVWESWCELGISQMWNISTTSFAIVGLSLKCRSVSFRIKALARWAEGQVPAWPEAKTLNFPQKTYSLRKCSWSLRVYMFTFILEYFLKFLSKNTSTSEPGNSDSYYFCFSFCLSVYLSLSLSLSDTPMHTTSVYSALSPLLLHLFSKLEQGAPLTLPYLTLEEPRESQHLPSIISWVSFSSSQNGKWSTNFPNILRRKMESR